MLRKARALVLFEFDDLWHPTQLSIYLMSLAHAGEGAWKIKPGQRPCRRLGTLIQILTEVSESRSCFSSILVREKTRWDFLSAYQMVGVCIIVLFFKWWHIPWSYFFWGITFLQVSKLARDQSFHSVLIKSTDWIWVLFCLYKFFFLASFTAVENPYTAWNLN